jgi:hypothetical protein
MATADLRAPKPKDSTTTLTVINTDPAEVVFRADVQPAGGGPAATGNVTFKDGGTTLGVAQIGGSFTSTTLPTTVTAYYGGDRQYNPSHSQTLTAPFA